MPKIGQLWDGGSNKSGNDGMNQLWLKDVYICQTNGIWEYFALFPLRSWCKTTIDWSS